MERIVQLGDSKHVITSDDLPFIIADVMESKEFHHITLLNCYINTGLNVESTASIRVDIKGKEFQGSGSGNGWFRCLHGCNYPNTGRTKFQIARAYRLRSYISPEVGKPMRLLNVLSPGKHKERDFKTRGVDANQVLAAVKATFRMINLLFEQ